MSFIDRILNGKKKPPIQKNIPIPLRAVNEETAVYKWGLMEVGDSFLANVKNVKNIQSQKWLAQRRYGFRFIARSTPEGVRVWRVN